MSLGRSAHVSLEVVTEGDRVVVLLVLRGKKENEAAALRRLAEWSPGLWMAVQLLAVAPDELIPAVGVVPEPAPQRVAGRDVLQPPVDGQVRLADAARPEPVHQEAFPVTDHVLAVDALHLDGHGGARCRART